MESCTSKKRNQAYGYNALNAIIKNLQVLVSSGLFNIV